MLRLGLTETLTATVIVAPDRANARTCCCDRAVFISPATKQPPPCGLPKPKTSRDGAPDRRRRQPRCAGSAFRRRALDIEPSVE